jgi:hypothetical protein
MGYDDWPGPELDDLARKIDAVDFDRVFVMDGSVLGFRHVFPDSAHGPETVEYDPVAGLAIDGVALADSEWSALTGFTGQYGYNGPIMHSSEFIGRAIARHMSYLSGDEPVTFVVCVVRGDDAEEDAGWCILYRPNVAPDFKCLYPGEVHRHEDHKVTCGNCGNSWCGKCDPAPSALCHWCNGRGHSTAPLN